MSEGPPTQSFSQRRLLAQEKDPRKVGIAVGATLGGTALVGLGMYAKLKYDDMNENALVKRIKKKRLSSFDDMNDVIVNNSEEKAYEDLYKELNTLKDVPKNMDDGELIDLINKYIASGLTDDMLRQEISDKITTMDKRESKFKSFFNKFKITPPKKTELADAETDKSSIRDDSIKYNRENVGGDSKFEATDGLSDIGRESNPTSTSISKMLKPVDTTSAPGLNEGFEGVEQNIDRLNL